MTAQTGAWGFGPQVDKNTPPDTWYRHKAINVGAGVIDLAQPGPPEVGGAPVPTIPHKAGYSGGGVIDFMPRFEGSFGFLLHALMGDYASAPAFDEDYILDDELLTVASQSAVPVDNGLPVTTGRTASVTVVATGNADFSGTITVNGTDAGDSPVSANFVFTAAVPGTRIVSTQVFKTITTVDLPAYENAGDTISVGYRSGVDHRFIFDATDQAATKWLGMRKYIPKVDGDEATDLLEEHLGVKLANFNMTLTNLGLLQSQAAWRGRDFRYVNDEPTDWENTYENDLSVPVSIKTEGYVKLTGAGLTDEKLKIINATIGMTNGFIPERVDRIYGDPRLYSLEVATRSLQLTLTARWENPEICKAVTGNDPAALAWNEVPLLGALDMQALSIANMTGETHPWALRMQASKTMMSITNPVALVSNQVVLLNVDLLAFENPGQDYATMTLRNTQAAGYYDWPTP